MFMLKSGLWGTMIATIMAPMQRYLWNAHAGVQGLFTRGKSMKESMNQDMKRALLGDHEASKRLTDAGVLVPCPFCGGEAEVVAYGPRLLRPSRNHVYSVSCNECEMMFGWDVDYGGRYDTEYEAMLAWNTRALILSAEELQRLEENT